MAHLVETMAYRHEVPWHGLGKQLTDNQPIEVWVREAGMEWSICQSPVRFDGANGDAPSHYGDYKVLWRSDDQRPLSVVSARYQVVQPREILEFYRDLVDAGGFELETAGVLKGGRKLWALARTGDEALLKGTDLVKGYLLLATACDGTLATTAQFTSVRVVCNNTLQLAVNSADGAIRVPHSTVFDAAEVKKQLGLGNLAWMSFISQMKTLASRPVAPEEAKLYLTQVLGDPGLPFDHQPARKALERVYELYAGAGRGADLEAASGTAWGLLNAVTQFVDHERRTKSPDHRLDSAWFGTGAAMKRKALDQALFLAA